MNTYKTRIRAHGYVYHGFRDPIQKITGDAYRALLSIPDLGSEIDEKICWDAKNDHLLYNMQQEETYKEIADQVGCSASVARMRYAKLVKDGVCKPRKRTKPGPGKDHWYEQRHIDLLELLPVIGLANLSERFNRNEGDVAILARQHGWRYRHPGSRYGYWYKEKSE